MAVVPGDFEDQPGDRADGGARSGNGSRRSRWRSWRVITPAVVVAVALAGAGIGLLEAGGPNQPSGSVIFRSDFSNTAEGWQVRLNPADGHVQGLTYYIRANSSGTGETGIPTNASKLYPSAPSNIGIDVSARGSNGPIKDIQYGIVCRYGNGSYYAFEVQDTQVTIGKFKNNGFRALGSTNVGGIHVGAANQLTEIGRAHV